LEVIGLKLPLVKPGMNVASAISKAVGKIGGLKDGDVLVITSKIVATAQGRVKDLARIKPSTRARRIARRTGQAPEFVELVLREADRVLKISKGVMLTIKDGLICANAGVDLSNVPKGKAVLLPANPDMVAKRIRAMLSSKYGARIGVIISDSVVHPLRLGTVAQAIAVAGIEPVIDCRGQPDLYGKPLRITFRAVADQMATAAQLVMGEGGERIPAAVIRGSMAKLTEKPTHSPKMPPERCLHFGDGIFLG
jgi:coenzyme F420-0:L-glutamate ligase/coenzyme F420-1:gamma-L-glutamate ligase